jgi:hypothetical protein
VPGCSHLLEHADILAGWLVGILLLLLGVDGLAGGIADGCSSSPVPALAHRLASSCSLTRRVPHLVSWLVDGIDAHTAQDHRLLGLLRHHRSAPTGPLPSSPALRCIPSPGQGLAEVCVLVGRALFILLCLSCCWLVRSLRHRRSHSQARPPAARWVQRSDSPGLVGVWPVVGGIDRSGPRPPSMLRSRCRHRSRLLALYPGQVVRGLG